MNQPDDLVVLALESREHPGKWIVKRWERHDNQLTYTEIMPDGRQWHSEHMPAVDAERAADSLAFLTSVYVNVGWHVIDLGPAPTLTGPVAA